jgi:hypothetical protein
MTADSHHAELMAILKSEHQEVPKEKAAVESTEALENRYGDLHHRQPKMDPERW